MPKINSFIGLVKSHYYDINIINLIPTISIKEKGKQKKHLYVLWIHKEGIRNHTLLVDNSTFLKKVSLDYLFTFFHFLDSSDKLRKPP